MSNTKNRQGGCLCGAVKFTVDSDNHTVGACHCGMCRNWGGGPFMAVDCGSNIEFSGSENISVYNSSDWAERGFCSKCGSHLFYRLKETKQHMVPAGLFENNDDFVFDHQIFIDKKPSYYDFENKTEKMTEEQVFARYAP
jgi:hypothetical protein